MNVGMVKIRANILNYPSFQEFLKSYVRVEAKSLVSTDVGA